MEAKGVIDSKKTQKTKDKICYNRIWQKHIKHKSLGTTTQRPFLSFMEL